MSTIEAKFAALQSEWLTVCHHVREDIAQWEFRFGELEEEEIKLRDEGRWTHGRDDYLGVLGRHRDELAHSRMIKWLLDPCARHGLGTRFLAGVIQTAFGSSCDVSGLERAVTRCEVPLVDGRLDIVVEAPGLYLVIENKVDAAEAENQCAYYAEHLPPDAWCILLSPDGRLAKASLSTHETDAEVTNEFQPLQYAQLAAILEEALVGTTSVTSGRSVAEHYLKTLKREFS